MAWFTKSSKGEPAAPSEAEASAPEIEPLTDAEVEWVRTSVADLGEQDVRAGDIDDLGRHYDELLGAWSRLREPDRPDPNAIVTQIGLAFGQYVADHAGLDWVIATDPGGPEIALHRAPGDVLIYPTTMVAERWEAGERGMLPALARATVDRVDQIS
jgi:hypothetical protein